MLVRLLRIFQTYCFMINSLRRLIWKFLGINFYNFLKNKKHINLKDADWVQLGKNSYDNGAYVWRWNTNSKLVIGNFCSIANDVHFICDSGYHGESEITSFPLFHEVLNKEDDVVINSVTYKVKNITNQLPPQKQNITIGHDVWIGARATILPNVTIGNGVTILAGAVVSDDIPDYAVVGGVPAKVISFKHNAIVIQKLNKIAWWNWDEKTIKKNVNSFYLPIEEFIKIYS